MTAPQNSELSRIIGVLARFAGAVVGTAVIIGKRIASLTTQMREVSLSEPVTPKKKPIRRKTKNAAEGEVSILSSETVMGTTTLIETQEPQAQPPSVESEMADKQFSSVNGASEEGVEKKGATES